VSYAIKMAKAGGMGDPGLFGFLGKAIGGVASLAGRIIPGPIGAVAGLAGRALTGSKGTSVVVSSRPFPGVLRTAGSMGGSPPLLPGSVFPPGINIGGPKGITIGSRSGPSIESFGGGGFNQPLGVMAPGGGTTGALVGRGAGTPCVRGYHYNKTGYFTKRYGYVEPGSVCVKNRRRNPLNPRALSRAMARLSSAKQATKFLSRFSIREEGCRKCRGK